MTIEYENLTTLSWQKLSKWSVIHFVARSLNQLISIFLGMFAVNATLPDSAGQYVSFSGMVLILILLITIFACFKYVYFSYQATHSPASGCSTRPSSY